MYWGLVTNIKQRLDEVNEQHTQALVRAAREELAVPQQRGFTAYSGTDCLWLRIATVVRDIGLPAVILIWFMAMWSGWVPSPMTAIAADIRAHRDYTEKAIPDIARIVAQQHRLMQLICTGVVDRAIAPECLR